MHEFWSFSLNWKWITCVFFHIAAGAAGASTSSNRASIPRDPSVIILPTDNFGENEVKELVSLGFTREQVRDFKSSLFYR